MFEVQIGGQLIKRAVGSWRMDVQQTRVNRYPALEAPDKVNLGAPRRPVHSKMSERNHCDLYRVPRTVPNLRMLGM